MTARVINFPENRIVRKTPEFSEALKKEGKVKAVEELVDFLNENLYNLLVMNGVEETEVFNDKDFPMLSETLRALVFRQFEIPHEFHKMIDVGYTVETVENEKPDMA